MEEMIDLDPNALLDYCMKNASKVADKELWVNMLVECFPDIYPLASTIEFVDLEQAIRSSKRQFLPMRDLYFQMLVASTQISQLSLVNALLNDEIPTDAKEDDKEEVRLNLQILSFLLAHTSSYWRKYLACKRDEYTPFLPFPLKELKDFLFKEKIDSTVLAEMYFGDSSIDPAKGSNKAIRAAASHGLAEVVSVLLSHPFVKPSARNNEAIRLASEHGHTEVVRLLLTDGRADPSADDNFAIRMAVKNGHAGVIELLLEDGRADPTVYIDYPIRTACKEDYAEIVHLLLKDGRVNPATCDNFMIGWAAENGHKNIVEVLLKDERVNPAASNNHAIKWAAENGYTEIVNLLLGDARAQIYI